MACAGATTLRIELERLTGPAPKFDLTANRFLELSKSAYSVYQEQDAAEQRRVLDTVLSNCTFDRGSLCPTYTKPFDIFVEANESGNWRREWDSHSDEAFGFCKLQILQAHRSHRTNGSQRTLHRLHRRLSFFPQGHSEQRIDSIDVHGIGSLLQVMKSGRQEVPDDAAPVDGLKPSNLDAGVRGSGVLAGDRTGAVLPRWEHAGLRSERPQVRILPGAATSAHGSRGGCPP